MLLPSHTRSYSCIPNLLSGVLCGCGANLDGRRISRKLASIEGCTHPSSKHLIAKHRQLCKGNGTAC